jgi:hypothetical protein
MVRQNKYTRRTMPNESRVTVGGKQGYTIKKVVVTDEEGNMIREFFELYDSHGKLIGTFPSPEEAEEALDKIIRPTPPSHRMRM